MSPPPTPDAQRYVDDVLLAAVTAVFGLVEVSVPGGVDVAVDRHPFLGPYVQELATSLPHGVGWDDALLWWQQHLAAVEELHHRELPLTRIPGCDDPAGRIALAMVALPTVDLRFGAVADELQRPIGGDHLSAQTVVAALERPGERRIAHLLQRLTAEGVLVADETSPRLLRIAPLLWDAVSDPGALDDLRRRIRGPGEGYLAHWSAERACDLRRPLELLVAGGIDTAIVREVRGGDGRRAVAAMLEEAGHSVLWCEPAELATGPHLALAATLSAVPATSLAPGPGERVPSPRPSWYHGPLVVVTGRSGGVAPGPDERLATVGLGRSSAPERLTLWTSLQPYAGEAIRAQLASSFVVPDGHLRRMSQDASVMAMVAGGHTPGVAEVLAASRQLGDHVLEGRADRVDADGLRWGDVVVSPSVETDLKLLAERCRRREELARGRSPGSAGVRALFTGPSGCGKTLAARVLASILARTLYRVDLAAIFDKYVGETEKKLDRLLGDAEQLDVVLLLDEGDTLLGNRTDVRSANDRWANLETNFLLQRLEDYSGIVVVTTNAPERIDGAFARRMDASVAFGRPGPAARRAIWELHLPAGHDVGPDALADLAARHRLTGGQIGNAVQHSRLLSARCQRPLTLEDLRAAIRAEYRKSGAMPVGRPSAPPAGVERMARALDALGAAGRAQQRAAAEP